MKKYIVLILGMVLSMTYVDAQIPEKEVRKSDRKEARREAREKKEKLTAKMLEHKDFVLKANYLSNNRGNRAVVNSTINFIQVRDEHATIQVGNNSSMGRNGVGGVTASGKITSWEMNENRRGGYHVRFNVLTSIGHYSINMNISGDGSARATLTGLSRGNLVYEGDIVPNESSRVYRGRTN
jgi:hypothetical protein